MKQITRELLKVLINWSFGRNKYPPESRGGSAGSGQGRAGWFEVERGVEVRGRGGV